VCRLSVAEFLRDCSGATLVEYGLAMTLAVTVGGLALISLANQTDANFRTACQEMVIASVENRCEGDN